MTISNEVDKVSYTGTGANTALSTTFPFFDDTDLVVTKRITATGVETVLTPTTHYTVSGGDGSTGTVTPVDGATDFPTTVTWTISRDIPKTQAADYVDGGDFDAESHETALDRLTLLVQDLAEKVARCVRFPITDSSSLSAELASSLDRLSTYLGFDSNGEPTYLDAPVDTTAVSTFGASFVIAADAAAALAILLGDLLTSRGDLLVMGASDPERLGVGLPGQVLGSDGTDPTWANIVLPGYFEGFTISNGTDPDVDVDISPGCCTDSSNQHTIRLTTAITKKIDATWSEGDGEGGMNDGETVGNSTWYHLFAIWNPTTLACDAGFDTDIDAANLMADAAVVAAGYTKHLYLWSLKTDGTADIIKGTHIGDEWIWEDPSEPGDYDSGANPGTSEIAATLQVPPDIQVLANLNIALAGGTSTFIYARCPDANDEQPQAAASPYSDYFFNTASSGASENSLKRTNTSSQIKYRLSASGGTTHVYIATLGWHYRRGSYR